MNTAYLGSTPVDVSTHHQFSGFTPTDWAMLFIEMYGQIDGGHHKAWVLDQVARILKGTPVLVELAQWSDGQQEYRFSVSPEVTPEYEKWVRQQLGDYIGDEYEYDYDEGIAP